MQGAGHHAPAVDQVADAFQVHRSPRAQAGVALDGRVQQHGAGHRPVEIGLGQALGFGGVGGQAIE